ncbi:phospho-N-acetylmuramoyl-pentapeptide-transferase [Truepera radiovictrix]|uniref:Phospho-N-acetylmuramoyl-pentapeptide-transferase n=1 Tax=Truepera radiovictrix (strain DSM 17093 / CIP 108686 / LMG 22925 / RQ-24) TaxID=649638 RepID=D7CY83_TRURR|nr:phospho-N-acetylmuramoyl-pentapeptide-transferase [Truepera radiovictrix]ADI14722.1 Glycosyl transferase, family 4, conserved region [Truepera radiovictrix DSM 17093]WMT56728.1 phospho-N-acetylmuramoyl-pentapeptide-transferase [Truepera radiovictrix]
MTVLVAALLSLFAVGTFVQLAKRRGWGKAVRQDGPTTHHTKAGTPTMGGAAFLLAALFTWLLFGPTERSAAVALLTAAAALLGLYDDLAALRRKRAVPAVRTVPAPDEAPPQRVSVHAEPQEGAANARPAPDAPDLTTGVLARYRLLIQSAAALVFALYAVRSGQELFGAPVLDLLGFAFIVVGSINAFNFTDGLDGLAAGVTALVLLPFVGAPFVGALLGALLGFLWFNARPARVFMGGVGSEALGAAVAGTAILAGWAWWLPLLALIPVLEVLSVIAQVSYFRLTKARRGEGQRLFKMSPLHHHFELSGWSEGQIVVRMWLVTAVCVALAWSLRGGAA